MSLTTKQIRVTTTGAAGSATGSGRLGIPPAVLQAIQVDYAAGQPATCDVTIKCEYAGISKTLLTLTDRNAAFPLGAVHEAGFSNTGAPAPTGSNAEFALPRVSGELVVDVAQADAASDAVVVTFLLEV